MTRGAERRGRARAREREAQHRSDRTRDGRAEETEDDGVHDAERRGENTRGTVGEVRLARSRAWPPPGRETRERPERGAATFDGRGSSPRRELSGRGADERERERGSGPAAERRRHRDEAPSRPERVMHEHRSVW